MRKWLMTVQVIDVLTRIGSESDSAAPVPCASAAGASALLGALARALSLGGESTCTSTAAPCQQLGAVSDAASLRLREQRGKC